MGEEATLARAVAGSVAGANAAARFLRSTTVWGGGRCACGSARSSSCTLPPPIGWADDGLMGTAWAAPALSAQHLRGAGPHLGWERANMAATDGCARLPKRGCLAEDWAQGAWGSGGAMPCSVNATGAWSDLQVPTSVSDTMQAFRGPAQA